MYAKHFGLRELPFNNTPDPRFFFPTPDHEEALATLIYAVSEAKGFVLLTGEVGTGKTLISRLMLRHFQDRIAFATVNHSSVSAHDLITLICADFDLNVQPDDSTAQLIHKLQDFLLAHFASNTPVVLVLDEAQNLPRDAFELLRTIGNLEADDAKLLQVVILGQPELRRRFQAADMRQLHQRLFRSFHLPVLDREQCAGYIRHRLRVAGGSDLFDESAVDVIYRFANGLPRLINTVCDNAMLSAYSAERSTIDGPFVETVIRQMMPIAGAYAATPDDTRPADALAGSETIPPAPIPQQPPPRQPSHEGAAIRMHECAGVRSIAAKLDVQKHWTDIAEGLDTIRTIGAEWAREQRAISEINANLSSHLRNTCTRLDELEQRVGELDASVKATAGLGERLVALEQNLALVREQAVEGFATADKTSKQLSRFEKHAVARMEGHEAQVKRLGSHAAKTAKRVGRIEGRVARLVDEYQTHVSNLELFAGAVVEARQAATEAFDYAVRNMGRPRRFTRTEDSLAADKVTGHANRFEKHVADRLDAYNAQAERLMLQIAEIAERIVRLDARLARLADEHESQADQLKQVAGLVSKAGRAAGEALDQADNAAKDIGRIGGAVARLANEHESQVGKLERFADTVDRARQAAGEAFHQAVKKVGRAEELARNVTRQIDRVEHRLARIDGEGIATVTPGDPAQPTPVGGHTPAAERPNAPERLNKFMNRTQTSLGQLRTLRSTGQTPGESAAVPADQTGGETPIRSSAEPIASPADALARQVANLAELVGGKT